MREVYERAPAAPVRFPILAPLVIMITHLPMDVSMLALYMYIEYNLIYYLSEGDVR